MTKILLIFSSQYLYHYLAHAHLVDAKRSTERLENGTLTQTSRGSRGKI